MVQFSAVCYIGIVGLCGDYFKTSPNQFLLLSNLSLNKYCIFIQIFSFFCAVMVIENDMYLITHTNKSLYTAVVVRELKPNI